MLPRNVKPEDVRPESLLTSEQVAGMLNVKVGTLQGWRARGVGPRYMRLNRQIRYSLADVRAYLADKAVK